MRILIHRLGSLGDTVVALPCFHFIRQKYPDAHITVLTNSPVSNKAAPLESILENTGVMDAVMHYPMGSRDWRGLARLHSEIRRQHFDLLISLTFGRHFHSSVRDYIYFRTAGIPKIIGLPFAKRDTVCQRLADGPGYEREADRLLRRAGGTAEVNLRDGKWLDLKLTDGELARGKQILDDAGVKPPFIVASMGTKWPSNHWGIKNWVSVLGEVGAKHPELTLVLLGSADEFEASEELLACWKGPTANLCGQAPPRVSAAILRGARLFLGHDSGPMHLASASGVRCVAVFSARNPPGQWFPLGEGHIVFYPYAYDDRALWDNAEYQREAIASISVKGVFVAIEEALRGA